MTLRAHRARGPLPPAHGEAEEGREIPQQQPPYCEAAHVLRPAGGGTGVQGCHRQSMAAVGHDAAPHSRGAWPGPSHGTGRGLRRGGPCSGLPRPRGGGLRWRKVCGVAGGAVVPSRFLVFTFFYTPVSHCLSPSAVAPGHEHQPPPALRSRRSCRSALCGGNARDGSAGSGSEPAMLRRPRTAPAVLPALLLLPLLLGGRPAAARCPAPCRCAGHLVACSRLELSGLPEWLPRGAVQL